MPASSMRAALVLVAATPAFAQLTERASVATGGSQANGRSLAPALSADGRVLAFVSEAFDLVPGDTNGCRDIFVRDRIAGTTERVSVAPGGSQANGGSVAPALSSDGRFLSFVSDASDLVPGDTNASEDVFVRDRLLGTTERVSVSTAGVGGDDDTGQSSISADGRY